LHPEQGDRSQEIERIERWYRELRGPKNGLRASLRSIERRKFWAGLSELMTARIFVEHGWSSLYEPLIAGKTPDFSVDSPDGSKFLGEVLTTFQDPHKEKEEAAIYGVARELDGISHRVQISIEDIILPKQTVSLRPLLHRVRAWLDRCPPGRSHRITLSCRCSVKMSV
jgi:hypothetical protein